jgi:drug/metabolite transporter (DMT)-like permease
MDATTPPRSRRRSQLDLIAAMVTVGSIVPAGKLISGALPPMLAGAARLAVAALVLLPWALLADGAALREPRGWREAALLLLQAAAGTVGFTVLLLLGVARTTAADASVIAGTLPAVAAGLSVLLLGERPRPSTALAVALAVGGVFLVAQGGHGGQARDRIGGDLLVVGAVASEAIFILLQKRLRRPPPPLAQAALMTALGLSLLLPGAVAEAAGLDLAAVPARAWLAVAYYGLVPTVLGFFWWYRGAAGVPGSEAAVFTGVMPVAGALLSTLVLGEPLGLHHAGGLLLVLGGVALAARRR